MELLVRQQLICCFIDTFTQQRTYPPTMREVMDWTGCSNIHLAHHHVSELERKGYLTRTPYITRSLRLTEAGKAIARRWKLEGVARGTRTAPTEQHST
jgi:repressor LexA